MKASGGEEKDYQEDKEGNNDDDDVNDEEGEEKDNQDDGEGHIPKYNPSSNKDSIWYTLAHVNDKYYVWKDDSTDEGSNDDDSGHGDEHKDDSTEPRDAVPPDRAIIVRGDASGIAGPSIQLIKYADPPQYVSTLG